MLLLLVLSEAGVEIADNFNSKAVRELLVQRGDCVDFFNAADIPAFDDVHAAAWVETANTQATTDATNLLLDRILQSVSYRFRFLPTKSQEVAIQLINLV